ncbi:unnamed protein product [Ectocarpus sp. 6 AP-2014]
MVRTAFFFCFNGGADRYGYLVLERPYRRWIMTKKTILQQRLHHNNNNPPISRNMTTSTSATVLSIALALPVQRQNVRNITRNGKGGRNQAEKPGGARIPTSRRAETSIREST